MAPLGDTRSPLISSRAMVFQSGLLSWPRLPARSLARRKRAWVSGPRLAGVVPYRGAEMGVRGACLAKLGAPGDDVAGVLAVVGFGHVGLFAPDLGGGRGQVAVPVIEALAVAADLGQVAGG